MENITMPTKEYITAAEAEDIKKELTAAGIEVFIDYTDSHLLTAENGDCVLVRFEISDATDEKITALENALAKRGLVLHVSELEDMSADDRKDEVENEGVTTANKEVYGNSIYVSVPLAGIMDIFAVTEIDENTPEDVLAELVEKCTEFTEYGLPVVRLASGSYLIAKDKEAAEDAARDYIENCVWSFNASFLAQMTGIDMSVFETMQPKCEDAQEGVESIIEATCGMDAFVDAAIQADGLGHFLASYDGAEIEAGEYRVYQRD